jgi:hypothetical protein
VRISARGADAISREVHVEYRVLFGPL